MQETSPHTQTLRAADLAHLWHPFTPMRQWRERPEDVLIIEKGEGDFVIDTDGRRYIDGISSLWCNVHGHRVPEIDAAIRGQLDRIAHSTMLGLANVPAIELAARLVPMAPQPGSNRLNKVFYSDAGATATELAVKMAIGFQYHTGHPERSVIIAFSGAYHGDTVGAMSVGYSETFHKPFNALTFRTIFAPAPDVTNAPEATGIDWPWHNERIRAEVCQRCLSDFDRVLDEHEGKIAGVMIEPLVQGAAGIVTHPDGFLTGVASRCRERDLLLIADEVAVGLGKTGRMFACEHEPEVQPDILCLAKGISGGYMPLAATMCSDEIEAAFEGDIQDHKTLYHGHTYTGNPLACAAALASLDLFEQNHIIEHVQQLSRLAAHELNNLRDHPHVGDIRQRGLMIGIDIVQSRPERTRFDPARRITHAICMAARRHGIIIRPLGHTIILMPMPAMEVDHLRQLIASTIRTLEEFPFREYA